MNQQLVTIRSLILDVERLTSQAAENYAQSPGLAVQTMTSAEAIAHQIKVEISKFLETDHTAQ